MANLKSARSRRLGYSKPKSGSQPVMPQSVTLVDPISYIKFWDKYNRGESVDISKAKKMTRDDLMKADPRMIELMLAYGVPQKQIAMQYNTPQGSLTAIFKRLGVNTKIESVVEPFELMDLPGNSVEVIKSSVPVPVEAEKVPITEPTEIPPETAAIIEAVTASQIPEPTPEELPVLIANIAAEPTMEYITDPAKIAELLTEPEPKPDFPDDFNLDDFLVFNSANVRQSKTEPFISVSKNGNIRLSRPIGMHFKTQDRVTIKLHPEGHTIALVLDMTDGLRFTHPGSSERGEVKRLTAKHVADRLIVVGIEMPARYTAERRGELWVGRLM